MLVKEFISFKRGQSPTKSLNIGDDRTFQHGDKILLTNTDDILIYNSTPGLITGNTYFKNTENTIKIPLSTILKSKKLENDYSWTRINESMNFKRGQNPHNALSVGKYKPFAVGDMVYIKPNFLELFDEKESEVLGDQSYRRDMMSLDLSILYEIILVDGSEILATFHEHDNNYNYNFKIIQVEFSDYMLSHTDLSESMNFKRGQHPYKSLGLGKFTYEVEHLEDDGGAILYNKFTIYPNQKFSGYEEAIKFLKQELNDEVNDELYSFLYTTVEYSDIVDIGDESIAASDLFDFL